MSHLDGITHHFVKFCAVLDDISLGLGLHVPRGNRMTMTGVQNQGCYQCGSSEGSFQRLCPACTASYAEKRSKLRQQLHVDTTGESDPFVFRIMTMPATFALSAVLLSVGAIGAVMMMAGRYGISEVALLLAITAAVTFLLMVGSWVTAWLTVKQHETQCARLALICPPLIYKPIVHAMREGEESQLWRDVRIVFTAHVVGAVLFVSTIAVAFAIDVNIFKGRSYVKTLEQ